MDWKVMVYDFNLKRVVPFNIFDNIQFSEGIKKIMDHTDDRDTHLKQVDKLLRYCFWSKREYEISVGDAFEDNINNFEKYDVYWQVRYNLSNLVDYIRKYYGK